MNQGERKLIEYLREAHATELELISTLRAHLSMTPAGIYRSLLERHLRETQTHARRVERRLSDLGFERRPWEIAAAVAQNLAGQLLVLAKGPLDMLRGPSLQEKLLKNARDEAVSEQLEIATYDAIERMAAGMGDDDTAALAGEIRADEERMLAALSDQLPELVDAVVAAEIPASQRQTRGDAVLPIPNYDSLTANEITRRLEGLTPNELRTVATYERRNRNRATVLRRIEQLSERQAVTA